MTQEALKLALEALEGFYEYGYDRRECFEHIAAIKKALANHIEDNLTMVAQPEQEPVAWKLMPRDATDSMLKAMDECSTEGYDERLYAGHAASVYTAAWDAAPITPAEQGPTGCACRWDSEGDRVVTCARHEGWLEVIAEWADRAREAEKKLKALAQHDSVQAKPEPEQEPVMILPDGSAFGVMSFPLPDDHWLYAPNEYKDGEYEPIDLPKPILTHALRDAVVAAVRYAVRGATMRGQETDFDPDALVQNAVYALCGPYVTPPQRPRVVFPTMLRKMWSGSEVQAWLDENVNKENK